MFSTETLNQIKTLVKEHGTTQASLIDNLVRFALENADVSTFDLAPAKKRGRPAKPKTEPVESVTVEATSEDANEADESDTEMSPEVLSEDAGSDTVEVSV